jgi:hypothetical protein
MGFEEQRRRTTSPEPVLNPMIDFSFRNMHWLIPVTSHIALGLLAWPARSITLAGIFCICLLAGTQYVHPWAAFYGLSVVLVAFVVFATLISSQRDAGAAFLFDAILVGANILIAAVLTPLHHSYLQGRLSSAPWFHTFRAPAGCLPLPSRTLTEPFKFNFLDAVGNQLPYGIIVSYAVAMGCMLGVVTVDCTGVRQATWRTIGAFVVAMTAAYTLPMCGADVKHASHQVTMHVDRSTEWKERSAMTVSHPVASQLADSR